MPRILFPFLSGLALGATTTWFALPDTRPTAAPIAHHPSGIPHYPSLSSSSAIAAWRALRTSASHAGPAGYAARAAALRALLLQLPASEFPRLLDTFSDAERDPDELALRLLAFACWTELDPVAAARWAVSAPSRHELARDALNAWSARDARAAAAWICALPDEPAAPALAGGPLAAYAKQNGPAAVALAAARGDAFLRKVLPDLLPVLAQGDPAGAVRNYGPLLWDGGRGMFKLRDPLTGWLQTDPDAAIAWIVAQPRSGDVGVSNVLGWITPAPDQYASLADTFLALPDLPQRQATLANLLATWTGVDSAAAVAWLDRLPNPRLRALLLDRALQGMHAYPPARTLPFALALPESENRNNRIERLLSDWASQDPSAALRWTSEHSADPAVNAISFGMHATALGAIARDEPATAVAEWRSLPAGPMKYASIQTISEAWGLSDPAAAIQWHTEQARLAEITMPPDQGTIYAWARRDELAALRWAESLPAGELRQHGLAALTRHASARLPHEAAVNLYARLTDPALRAELVTTHVREWLAKDPASARAWLDSHDALTPEQTATLLAK